MSDPTEKTLNSSKLQKEEPRVRYIRWKVKKGSRSGMINTEGQALGERKRTHRKQKGGKCVSVYLVNK